MSWHDSAKRASRKPLLLKAAIVALLFASSVVFNQACGGFSSAIDGQSSAASAMAPFSIVSSNGASGTGQTLSFGYVGMVMPAGSIMSWSHIFADANGTPLPTCKELDGEANSSYEISCTQAGILTLALDVTDAGGARIGAAQLVYSIGGASAVPTTPMTGPNAAGAASFTTSCSLCHGPLDTNNVGPVPLSAIQNAIQSQPAMSGLSTLSTAELQTIADALNGK